MPGSTGKDTVINLECHVHLGSGVPGAVNGKEWQCPWRGIRLLPSWRPGWTCPLGDLVRGRESAGGGPGRQDCGRVGQTAHIFTNQPLPLGVPTEEVRRGRGWMGGVVGMPEAKTTG